ncbi:cytochrome c oxidase assembly protein subunit 11 [Luteimonas sp. J16]|uniref:cytochrome c oxidase assembly protein n=1 Tax=unclassified Luteimonas TaxID=2629088 RepID=UPI00047D793F|nr:MULTISPECIES: cytochrome c oxidase assembly protein [unclassified Luteimonas]TWG90524.1 cytochrome c oxidase assembly protein subunit 11 [Luteimonas sp. J16]
MSAGRKFGIAKLLGVSLAAFAFTFSLVPLYRIACEKVFGIRLENGAADASAIASATPAERWVTVEFDSTVNSKLPWAFEPNATRMRVKVGEQYEATYAARNRADRPIVGSATPSVAPARASGYFNKTECFCFTAQTLMAGEERDLPVRFIIDPALPPDVHTITLSYTIFKNDVLTERLAAAAPSSTVPHSAP